MIRSAIEKTTVLAMSALLMSASIIGCNNKENIKPPTPGSDVGSASFALTASGLEINTVHYRIDSVTSPPPATMSREADVAVPGAGPSASFLVSGLAADRYSIALSATGTPVGGGGVVACSGSSTFTVVPGMTVRATVVLNCGETKTVGSVAVNTRISFNNCPSLTSYLLSSTQVAPGGFIDLSAAGSDRDPANTLSFSWAATNGGTFANASAATTRYTCPAAPAAGPHVLTVTVANGVSTDPAACNATGAQESITILCVDTKCGNGFVDPGEACDHGATNGAPSDTCTYTCRSNTCGNGMIDAGETCDDGTMNGPGRRCSIACVLTPICGDSRRDGAEACDDGNVINFDGCSSTCTVETPVCGNGQREMGEACDDGNLVSFDGCSATCTVETPVCGNGRREMGEACDDGNLVNFDGCSATCTVETATCGNGQRETGEACDDGNVTNLDGCSSTCRTESACFVCEETNRGGTCQQDMGCANLTVAADRVLCEAMLTCMVNNPTCWATNPQRCLCGTATGTSCATAPNGVCRNEAAAAAKTVTGGVTDWTATGLRFFSLTYPVGHATTQITCDISACGGNSGVCSAATR